MSQALLPWETPIDVVFVPRVVGFGLDIRHLCGGAKLFSICAADCKEVNVLCNQLQRELFGYVYAFSVCVHDFFDLVKLRRVCMCVCVERETLSVR